MTRPLQTFGLLLSLLLWPWELQAINANLLPKGKGRLRVYHSSIRGNDRFGASGERQPLGQTGLDQLAAKGIPPAVANAYSIENRSRYTQHRTDWEMDFGIAPKLNLGLWIPVEDASLDQSPLLTQGGAWGAIPAAQQAAIRQGVGLLDRADTHDHEFGDILVGIKTSVIGQETSRERLSLGGGVRLPTGHLANPLDSGDIATGDGQWDLSLWTWFDFQPSPGFTINLHTHHDYGLPGKRPALWPTNAARTAKMGFQPGFHHDIQLEPQWHFPLGQVELEPSLLFLYSREENERQQSFDLATGSFTGSRHTAVGTSWQRLLVKPALGLDLLPMGLPAVLSLGYGSTVWGTNTVDFTMLELRLDLYFDTN
ncbi:MAG: hypothetical protein HQL57_09670 [Magnetococcales bacterium]|nr:hypothetical protein [Magnetococcales bacterium]